jgi:DNA-binding beta-propeller fold protein YncE
VRSHIEMSRGLSLGLAAFALASVAASGAAQESTGTTYWAYVANESSDLVSLVRFDDGVDGVAVEEKTIKVGKHPADLDGAHGITVAPDGKFWYVSIAHGQPYGQIWKHETGSDRFVDSTTVGLFPSTMAITPDGSTLLAANFNLHGDPLPSSVSPVYALPMAEGAKIETCVRPHGSRTSRDGRFHYSGCLLSDQLVEIDLSKMEVTRRLLLTSGHEGITQDGPGTLVPADGACRPAWVVPSADDTKLYVTCNARMEVLELSQESLAIERRFATGKGPYNADVTPDGRYLVVTLKGEQSVTIIDLETGSERRVATSQPVTHGVVVTPDSRFAFVTNEARGATRGTVDIVDLRTARVVSSVDVQYQPGGIGFWKMEEGR